MPNFPEPTAPYPNVLAFRHEHNLTILPTARREPNGTFSSLWACDQCPDVFIGGKVGPIPDGYCPCGWVQRKPGRKKCEECKRPLLRSDKGPCALKGPYLPVGDTEWTCLTHNVPAVRIAGEAGTPAKREEMACPTTLKEEP